MSTRFHDKWHGANHQSASANGVPDSARDPIASYVFPFNGEFVMNNSPRASGCSNGEWSGQLNSWILSSDKIDVNTIRSQQDDSQAVIALSARYGENANYVYEDFIGSEGGVTLYAYAGETNYTHGDITGATTVVARHGDGTESIATEKADKLDYVVKSGANWATRVEATMENNGRISVSATSGIAVSANQLTRMSSNENAYAYGTMALSGENVNVDSSTNTHIGSLVQAEVVAPRDFISAALVDVSAGDMFVNGNSHFAGNGDFTAKSITVSSNGGEYGYSNWYPNGYITETNGLVRSPQMHARDITATNGYFEYLSAVSADVTRMDVHVSELSGYLISGTDGRTSPPTAVNINNENVLHLSGVGFWSDSWMHVGQDAAFSSAVGISGNETVGKNLLVEGGGQVNNNLLVIKDITARQGAYVSGGLDVGPGGVWTEGMLESSAGIGTSGDMTVGGDAIVSGDGRFYGNALVKGQIGVGYAIDFCDENVASYNEGGIIIRNDGAGGLQPVPHVVRGAVAIGDGVLGQSDMPFVVGFYPGVAIGSAAAADNAGISIGANAKIQDFRESIGIQLGSGTLSDDNVALQIESTPIISGWKFNRELYDFYSPTGRSGSALWAANPFFESSHVSAVQEVVRDAIGVGSGEGAPIAIYGRSEFDGNGVLLPSAAGNKGQVLIGDGIYSAVSDAIVIGNGASATAPSHGNQQTIQIGVGVNSGNNGGLQVYDYPLLGWDGKIPNERLYSYLGSDDIFELGYWEFGEIALEANMANAGAGAHPSSHPVAVANVIDSEGTHRGEGWISGICSSAANLLYHATVEHADIVHTAGTVNTVTGTVGYAENATTVNHTMTATSADTVGSAATAIDVEYATTVGSAHMVSGYIGSATSVTSAWNATVVGSAQAVGVAAYVGSATEVESVYEVATVMGNAGSVGSAGEVATAETVSTAGQVDWTSYVGSALDVGSADSVVYVDSALSIGASAFNTYLYETLAEGATAVPLDINHTLYRLAMPSTPTAGTYTYPVIDYTGIGNADGTIYAFRMEIEVPSDAVAFSPQTGGTGQQMDQWDWISEFPDPSVCSGKTVCIAAELDCAATARTVTANTWRVK